MQVPWPKKRKFASSQEPSTDSSTVVVKCNGLQSDRVDDYSEQEAAENNSHVRDLLLHFSFFGGVWRSNSCSFVAENDLDEESPSSKKKLRCLGCLNAAKHIRDAQYPFLFQADKIKRKSFSSMSPNGRHKRQKADSNYPFQNLSPDSQLKRYRNVRMQSLSRYKRLKYLETKISEQLQQKDQVSLHIDDEKGRQFFQSIFGHIAGRDKETLVKVIMENLLSESINLKDSAEAIEEKQEDCREYSKSPEKKDSKSEEEKKSKVAKYCNQFRFRSVYGKTWNCEYHFNNGSLSGEELVHQFFHVIIGLESVGARVYLMLCDGGGNNARMYKLLIGNASIDDYWLDEEAVSIKNPFDPSRKIFLAHCMTHNHKGARNALHKSSHGKPRNFIYPAGVPFGWNHIVDAYEREQERRLAGKSRETRLSVDAVFPDKWQVMNVSLCHITFEYKTVTELMVHLAEKLSCVSGLVFRDDITRTKTVLLEKRLEFLKEAVKTQQNSSLECKSLLACIEFMVRISIIYNEHFQNRKCAGLNKGNIETIEKLMKRQLEYFGKWQEDVKKRSVDWDTSSTKWFLAPQTWLNLRIGVRGFLLYAKTILEMGANAPAYVPFFHSNTSSLEGFFGMVRASRNDTAVAYGGFVGASDNNVEGSFLEKNGMYDRDPSDGSRTKFQTVTGFEDKERTKWLSNLLLSLGTSQQQGSTCQRHLFCDNGSDLHAQHLDTYARTLFTKLRQQAVLKKGNFRDALLADELFQEYCKLSYRTARQNWFNSFLTLDRQSQHQLEITCQSICEDLFKELVQGFREKASASASVYVIRVIRYNTSGALKTRLTATMPESLPYDLGWSVLLLEALSRIVADAFHQTVDRIKLDMLPKENLNVVATAGGAVTTNEVNKQVNRIVGWAINDIFIKTKSETSKLRQELERGNMGDFDPVSSFLESMFITHGHAIRDEFYLKHYYAISDQVRNRGSLKLVSAEFFKFGRELIMETQTYNKAIFDKLGADSIKWAYKKLLENESIKKTFSECGKERSNVSDEARDILYKHITQKVFHAKVGDETMEIAQELCGHKAKGSQLVAMRTNLKVLTAAKKEK